MEIEIIEATESHIPDIVELWREAMDFHRDIDSRYTLREGASEHYEKHLRDLMGAEDTLVLVALDKRKVVGFSVVSVNENKPIWKRESYGFIDTMAITSDYRRRGIGEQMLGKIFEWFASRGVDMIELSLAARNQVGYSFWKKHGFRDFMHRLYLQRE